MRPLREKTLVKEKRRASARQVRVVEMRIVGNIKLALSYKAKISARVAGAISGDLCHELT
jgi:hypothetical protein